MNHIVIACAAAIFLVGGIILNMRIGDAQGFYDKENEKIVQMNGKYQQQKAIDTFLAMHPIKQLMVGYPPPEVSGERTLIKGVPVINQFPELPVGCEITSAAVLLNYIGFSVEKVSLSDEFLPRSVDFFYAEDGIRYGPNPSKYFIGDPKNNGLGCLAPVIADSLDKFFAQNDSKNYAIQLQNADHDTLETLLDNGIPIEVWASRGMQPFRYTVNNEWVIIDNNETFMWPGNSHALVLVGYDKNMYYFSDCDEKSEIIAYNKQDFLKRWDTFGRQGIIVRQIKD